MQRREFIKSTCLGCASITASALFLQSCNTVKYVMAIQTETFKLVIKKSDFAIIKKDKIIYRKWVLVKTEKASFPIGVFRFDEDRYSALYLECTHQGCEVAPQGDHLACPCHGSEFSNSGKVQHGPAENDLQAFKVENDQENIYILLK